MPETRSRSRRGSRGLLSRPQPGAPPSRSRSRPPGAPFPPLPPGPTGATARHRPLAGPGSRVPLTGTWSTSDPRRLKRRGYVGEGVLDGGGGGEGFYERKPNRRFYGIGNQSSPYVTYFLRL